MRYKIYNGCHISFVPIQTSRQVVKNAKNYPSKFVGSKSSQTTIWMHSDS